MAPGILWFPDLVGVPASIWEPGGSDEEAIPTVCNLAPFDDPIGSTGVIWDYFNLPDGGNLAGNYPEGDPTSAWTTYGTSPVFLAGTITGAPGAPEVSTALVTHTADATLQVTYRLALAVFLQQADITPADFPLFSLQIATSGPYHKLELVNGPSGTFLLNLQTEGDGIHETRNITTLQYCTWYEIVVAYNAALDTYQVTVNGTIYNFGVSEQYLGAVGNSVQFYMTNGVRLSYLRKSYAAAP